MSDQIRAVPRVIIAPRKTNRSGIIILRSKTVRKFFRNKGTILGLVLVIFTLATAIIGPYLTPYSPSAMGNAALSPPNNQFIFGTDVFGRDVLSRVMSGMRLSLSIGLIGAGFAMIAGLIIGLVAGYFGELIDKIIMGISDIFQAIPVLLFAISIMTILGQGVLNTIVAIAITFTPSTVRLTRGSVLSVKKREFIEAMHAAGASHFRIMFRHILPNILTPIVVMSTMSIGLAILIESSLAFIGLGPKPPEATLGSIVAEGKSYVESAWWISTLSGFMIMLIVMGYNLLGDGLRDLLDQRGADHQVKK